MQMARGALLGAFPLDGNAALSTSCTLLNAGTAKTGLQWPACLADNRIAFVYFSPTHRGTGKRISAEGMQNSTLLNVGLNTMEHGFPSLSIPQKKPLCSLTPAVT